MQNMIATPSVHEMAKFIATEAPTLKELNNEQLKEISKLVLTQRLASELNTEVNIAGIDYNKEKNTFISNSGRSNSKHTQKVYRDAIDTLEAYTTKAGIRLLSLSPAETDDFIYDLKSSGKAPATIHKNVAGCSSFFTFLERRYTSIHNPFRGTKARPQKKSVRKTEIPTEKEVQTILQSVPPVIRCALSLMAFVGLRAGALPSLRIVGNRYDTTSKGKEISGTIPDKVLNDIKDNIVDWKTPFQNLTVNAIEKKVAYYCRKLHNEGVTNASYSCHDFRHFFAVQEYTSHKDIYRVSKLLHHASIQVTETYLKSIKVIN